MPTPAAEDVVAAGGRPSDLSPCARDQITARPPLLPAATVPSVLRPLISLLLAPDSMPTPAKVTTASPSRADDETPPPPAWVTTHRYQATSWQSALVTLSAEVPVPLKWPP